MMSTDLAYLGEVFSFDELIQKLCWSKSNIETWETNQTYNNKSRSSDRLHEPHSMMCEYVMCKLLIGMNNIY